VKKTLILYAHPNAESSRANSRLLSSAREQSNVTVRSLYDLYPEFYIDVAAEQKALREHEFIVFQFPIYWYSCPPLLKLWMDQVLAYNFAYGPTGDALKDKSMMLSITAGGSNGAYSEAGAHGFPLESFLLPFLQTARMCAMRWERPELLHHALDVPDSVLLEHGEKFKHRIHEIQIRGEN
jgi:glutathione-regulated potassium-efflux system ancillary protein KefG